MKESCKHLTRTYAGESVSDVIDKKGLIHPYSYMDKCVNCGNQRLFVWNSKSEEYEEYKNS